MTETPHTRLGRVIQQLTSFGDLHANELESMAVDLEAAGAPEMATRLRQYRDVQRDEGTMVVDELVDLQSDLVGPQPETAPPDSSAFRVPRSASDPAVNSPKRARWLAEQAAEDERRKAPMSRRGFLAPNAERGTRNAER